MWVLKSPSRNHQLSQSEQVKPVVPPTPIMSWTYEISVKIMVLFDDSSDNWLYPESSIACTNIFSAATTPAIGVSSLETLSEKLLERHSPVAMETQLGQTLESVLFKVVD